MAARCDCTGIPPGDSHPHEPDLRTPNRAGMRQHSQVLPYSALSGLFEQLDPLKKRHPDASFNRYFSIDGCCLTWWYECLGTVQRNA